MKNFHYHWHVTSTVSFSHIKADTWMRVYFRRTNQDMNKQKPKPSNRKNKKQDWSPLQPLQDRRPTRSWLPSQVRRSGCCWAEKRSKSFYQHQHDLSIREIKSNGCKTEARQSCFRFSISLCEAKPVWWLVRFSASIALGNLTRWPPAMLIAHLDDLCIVIWISVFPNPSDREI